VKYALLLYVRSNEYFHPSDWCETSAFNSNLMGLVGGDGVKLWEAVGDFPVNDIHCHDRSEPQPLDVQEQMLVDRLERADADALSHQLRRINGAVFQPTDKNNMGGDVFGLFRAYYWIIRVACYTLYELVWF
jgi:hypothetical protein